MQMEMKRYRILPDKIRIDMTLVAMGMKMSRVYDGQSAWMVTPQGVQPLPGSQVEEFRKSLSRDTISLLTYLSDDNISVQYVGEEDVNGKPADVILIRSPATDSLQLFIDTETKYIVKKSYQSVSEEGPLATEEFVDDYRDVSGVKIGFHVVVHQNGEKFLEGTSSEVIINVEVDESLFEK
jgi:LysM repeat protein